MWRGAAHSSRSSPSDPPPSTHSSPPHITLAPSQQHRAIRRTALFIIAASLVLTVAIRSLLSTSLLFQRAGAPAAAAAGAAGAEAAAAASFLLVDAPVEKDGSTDSVGSSTGSHHQGPPAGAGGARPAEFEGCGRWQEAYAERHRRILAGELPARYLVAVLHDAGVADQLLGVVTAFYWALLTGRAFQITTGHQQLPPLESAFDAPFVNWTRPLDPPEYTERLYLSFQGDDGDGDGDGDANKNHKKKKKKTIADADRAYPVDGAVDTSRYAAVYLSNNNTANDRLFLGTDLRTVFPEHAVVFTASNRGRSYRLFDNPHHRRALQEMGLRPETAFGCAFRFLFRANAAVLQTEAMQLAKTALRPTASVFADGRETQQPVLRIGIQVRAGDWAFDSAEEEQGLRLKHYQPFFDCAAQIEAFARPPAPGPAGGASNNVRWYIISDSARLRKRALSRLGGDKVVTLTRAHAHVACNVGDCGGSDDEDEEKEEGDGNGAVAPRRNQTQALLDAVGDLLSFSRSTDYKVLTQKSGFGKVAAMLALDGWHNVYWPDKPIGKGSRHNSKNPRKIVSTVGTCSQRDYVSLEDLSDGWSGL